MAIKIDFLANTRDVVRGGQDIEETFEKVADSLDDVARDGQRAGDKLGDGIRKGQRVASDATERLERSFKDLADESKQQTRRMETDFDQVANTKKHQTSENIREIKQEALANASETFSSFNGSASSFADGVQGTLGGLIASLPPQLAAVGAVGALAIGFITNSLQQADTTSEEFKQSVSEWTAELIDSGKVGQVSVGFIVDELKRLATESDAAQPSLAKFADVAKRSGSSYKDLADGYAGNSDKLDELIRKGKAHREELEKSQAAVLNSSAADKSAAVDIEGKIKAQDEYNNYLDQAATRAKNAAEQQLNYAKAGGPEMETKAAQIAQLDAAYDDAAGAVSDYIDEESGIFNGDAYLAAMEAKTKALHDYQSNLATSGLGPDAEAYLSTLGAQDAATLVQAYVTGTDAQKGRFQAVWNEAGKTSSGAYKTALEAGLPKTLPAPTITPAVDTSSAQAALNRLAAQKLTISVEGLARNGLKIF